MHYSTVLCHQASHLKMRTLTGVSTSLAHHVWTHWQWSDARDARARFASPSHTDPENHSGTYSGKDLLQKTQPSFIALCTDASGKATKRRTAWPQVQTVEAHNKRRSLGAVNQNGSSGSLLSPNSAHTFWWDLLHATLQTSRNRKFWESILYEEAKFLFSRKCFAGFQLCALQVLWRGRCALPCI